MLSYFSQFLHIGNFLPSHFPLPVDFPPYLLSGSGPLPPAPYVLPPATLLPTPYPLPLTPFPPACMVHMILQNPCSLNSSLLLSCIIS